MITSLEVLEVLLQSSVLLVMATAFMCFWAAHTPHLKLISSKLSILFTSFSGFSNETHAKTSLLKKTTLVYINKDFIIKNVHIYSNDMRECNERGRV